MAIIGRTETAIEKSSWLGGFVTVDEPPERKGERVRAVCRFASIAARKIVFAEQVGEHYHVIGGEV